MFALFDTDSSGALDAKEIVGIVRQMGIPDYERDGSAASLPAYIAGIACTMSEVPANALTTNTCRAGSAPVRDNVQLDSRSTVRYRGFIERSSTAPDDDAVHEFEARSFHKGSAAPLSSGAFICPHATGLRLFPSSGRLFK